jgi:hypothetical protein
MNAGGMAREPMDCRCQPKKSLNPIAITPLLASLNYDYRTTTKTTAETIESNRWNYDLP